MAIKVEKKIELREPAFIADESFYVDDSAIVMGFPHEFKRDWFNQLDWRFFAILLITGILEVALLFVLISYLKNYEKNVDVQKIQKQYAHLLLKDFSAEDFLAFENKKENKQLLTSMNFKNLNISNEETAIDLNLKSNVNKIQLSDEYRRQKQKLQDDKQQFLSRKASGKTENSFTSALTREVDQKGLLLLFSDKENSKVDENLAMILTNGKENERHLNSYVDNISLAKYQKIYSKLGNTNVLNNLKGSKSVISSDEELFLLNPLVKVEVANAHKNIELDYHEISDIAKNKNSRATRTAEYVTNVLRSHNRAIQDCYKQIIKNYPDVKGKVVVRVSVDADGSVDQVQIIDSTIKIDQMLRCITNRIRRWRDFGACDPELDTVNYKQTYVFGY